MKKINKLFQILLFLFLICLINQNISFSTTHNTNKNLKDEFCETIYLPKTYLDFNEEYTISSEIINTNSIFDIKLCTFLPNNNNFEIKFENNNKVIFKLKSQCNDIYEPINYSLPTVNKLTNKISGIICGTIIPMKKYYNTKLYFKINENILKQQNNNTYEIFIAGDMNNWDPKVSKLNYDINNNIFWIEFKNILHGKYKYKFVLNNNWFFDEYNLEREPDGFGSYNSILNIGPNINEDILIPSIATYDKNIIKLQISYVGTSNSPILRCFYKGIPINCKNISFDSKTSIFNIIIDTTLFNNFTNIKPSIMFFTFSKDKSHKLLSISKEYCFYNPFGDNNFYSYNLRDKIIYFLMIDRFKNSDFSNDLPINNKNLSLKCNYYGGDIKGIIEVAKTGYFNELGIDILWISPIFKGANKAFRDFLPPHKYFTNFHGYWPISHDEIEPRFGNKKLLQELITYLRNNKIETILDAVFKHVVIDSKIYKNNKEYFLTNDLNDGTKNIRLFDKYPETTWFDEFLPAFDFSNEKVINYLCQKANEWIKTYNVNGFRLDAVKHIPYHFWEKLLKDKNNFFTIGETIDSREKIASYIKPNMLKSQFDFPLYFAIIETIAKKNKGFDFLENEIKKSYDIFWYNHKLTSNLIGNHDFPRFMTYADNWFNNIDENLAKELSFTNQIYIKNPKNYKYLHLAYGLLFSLNGMPLIYYGDEYGECGGYDPDNRRMMRFNDNLNLFEKNNLQLIKKLIKLRKTHPALIEGVHVSLYSNYDILVFAKIHFNEFIILIFNKSEKAQIVNLNLNKLIVKNYFIENNIKIDYFYDMLTNEKFYLKPNLILNIPIKPIGFRYIKLRLNKNLN